MFSGIFKIPAANILPFESLTPYVYCRPQRLIQPVASNQCKQGKNRNKEGEAWISPQGAKNPRFLS